MAQDEYIKILMSNFRSSPNTKKEVAKEEKASIVSGEMEAVFRKVRSVQVKGAKKRLIKIDDKYEDLLRVLNPEFAVDVTKLMNFILGNFFEEHPEIVREIKKSQKYLKHELD